MILSVSNAVAQIDYAAPENIFRFAESLYSEKDYTRAITEYERFLFLTSANASQDSVLLRIGKAYRNLGDFQRSITTLQKISHPNTQDAVNNPCFQLALTYHMGRYYADVDKILDQCPTGPRADRNSMLLRGTTYLKSKYWEKAEELLRPEEGMDSDDPFRYYHAIAAKGMELPRKNILTAGLLSVVLPGAGKFYTERYVDGMYSLLTIGLTGWQAYDGFSKDGTRSVKGWIYGALCGGFYIGNVYGSIVAVNIYNTNLENELLKNVDVSIHIPMD